MKEQDPIQKFIESLATDLVAKFEESIPKILELIVETKFNSLKERLETLTNTLNIIQSDITHIKDDGETTTLVLRQHADELEAIRRKSQALPQQMQNTITDSIEKGQDKMETAIGTVIDVHLDKVPTKPRMSIVPKKKKWWRWF